MAGNDFASAACLSEALVRPGRVHPREERARRPHVHLGDEDDVDDAVGVDACGYRSPCAWVCCPTQQTVVRCLRLPRPLSKHPKRQLVPGYAPGRRLMRDAASRSCRWFPAIQSYLPCVPPFLFGMNIALNRISMRWFTSCKAGCLVQFRQSFAHGMVRLQCHGWRQDQGLL
jgi:hypothetical protein